MVPVQQAILWLSQSLISPMYLLRKARWTGLINPLQRVMTFPDSNRLLSTGCVCQHPLTNLSGKIIWAQNGAAIDILRGSGAEAE
jgi:hypothetical protein